MPSLIITITNPEGLHARPAALFVKVANKFPCMIELRHLSKNKPPVNAKSILGVLTLGVNQGDIIEIITNGEKAQEALNVLKELIESNFEKIEI
ncbi:MAG: HPr family phosphocarrier protein [Thermanaerothrix sp.]|uniref:HPr family phosphocarrier protein n=1 Tax=Thermanaerothrix sp. TaxID=2972675 RepID=UPI003C79A7A8